MVARARTQVGWSYAPWLGIKAGLREIDTEASTMHHSLKPEEEGMVRTTTMGGAIAKQDIAAINADVDDTCNYCLAAKSTSAHIRWQCSFFDKHRKELDLLLASTPLKCLLPCIQCGVAPSMKADGQRALWEGPSKTRGTRNSSSSWLCPRV